MFDIKTINFKLPLVYNTYCGSIGVGHYFVNYALSPASNSSERNVKTTVHASNKNELIMIKNKESEMKKADDFYKETSLTQIISKDKLKLSGNYKTQDTHK